MYSGHDDYGNVNDDVTDSAEKCDGENAAIHNDYVNDNKRRGWYLVVLA